VASCVYSNFFYFYLDAETTLDAALFHAGFCASKEKIFLGRTWTQILILDATL